MNEILHTPTSSSIGVFANELLKEFHQGYTIERLKPLLSSGNAAVVKVGVWIASELGGKATPLLADVVALLRHTDKSVRFDAIDSILSCATSSNKRELASVIPLIDDVEPAVRWKVMDFLSLASRDQLLGALSHLIATDPGCMYNRSLQWLLGQAGCDPDEVVSFIGNHDAIIRRFGVVAAARMASQKVEPLLYASSANDPDVKQFAADMLRLM